MDSRTYLGCSLGSLIAIPYPQCGGFIAALVCLQRECGETSYELPRSEARPSYQTLGSVLCFGRILGQVSYMFDAQHVAVQLLGLLYCLLNVNADSIEQ